MPANVRGACSAFSLKRRARAAGGCISRAKWSALLDDSMLTEVVPQSANATDELAAPVWEGEDDVTYRMINLGARRAAP
jgi:hypothetical protein